MKGTLEGMLDRAFKCYYFFLWNIGTECVFVKILPSINIFLSFINRCTDVATYAWSRQKTRG